MGNLLVLYTESQRNTQRRSAGKWEKDYSINRVCVCVCV